MISETDCKLWSLYAAAYDAIVEHSSEYWNLIEFVTEMVGDRTKCIDIGAGTGNVAVRLLESNPDIKVCAVEQNNGMLDLLRRKIAKNNQRMDRLEVVQADALDLIKFHNDNFDAAILVNVLHTMEHRERCLVEVNRLLAMDGMLVVSTADNETSIDELLLNLKKDLVSSGEMPRLAKEWELVCNLNRQWGSLFTRDSTDQILDLVTKSGFQVGGVPQRMYADSVIVLKARKIRHIDDS